MRYCYGFFYDLLDEVSLCSSSKFGKVVCPGKFSPFVDNVFHRGLLESRRLRNGFVTLDICELFCSIVLQFLQIAV